MKKLIKINKIKVKNRLDESDIYAFLLSKVFVRLPGLKKRLGFSPLKAGAILMTLIVVVQPLYSLIADVSKVSAYKANPPKVNMTGYIWENEDGSGGDDATQLAAGGTSIIGPKGSRINLRAQLKNTGQVLDTEDLGLFYDRGDGLWSKVKSSNVTATNAEFVDTSYVDTTGTVGQFSSIASESDGTLWVAYNYNPGSDDLKVAQYVGSGGTGCASTAWTCTTVDSTGVVGTDVQIAIDSSDNPWISYASGSVAKVARYVGSGGTGCASAAWTCTSVVSVYSTGQSIDIAYSGSEMWLTYSSTGAVSSYARYVGSGGTGCTSAAWTCGAIDSRASFQNNDSAIIFDGTGTAWVSYRGEISNDLYAAKYVGSGGTGCTSVTAWTCWAVDTAASVQQYLNSITIDGDGAAWISYYTGDLKVAQYVGSGGTGCASAAWTCVSIDTAGDAGRYSSIVTGPNDLPYVSYQDVTNTRLKVAEYVGSGGTGCASAAWTCSSIGNSGLGSYSSLTFDDMGSLWVSTYSTTGGDLVVLSVPNTLVTSGCDMVGPLVCTALDSTNTTGQYSSLALDPSGNPWISYHEDTTSICSTGGTCDLRLARYVGSGGTGCASTAWNCYDIVTTNSVGDYSSIAFDANGKPWVSYQDATNQDLYIAVYVGSGGTGCASTAWTCTRISGSANQAGHQNSIAFDHSGAAWVSYYVNTSYDLWVAKYVGGGAGAGCDSTDWTCTQVHSAITAGLNPTSINVDNSGNPWVAYTDYTNNDLWVARYVGGSGTGCLSALWTCTNVDSSVNYVSGSLAFDVDGNAMVSYFDDSNNYLRVAEYVSSGGTGCASTAWTCTTVDNDAAGSYSSIVFDPHGNAWISYITEAGKIRLARYVGGSLGNCTSLNWMCYGDLDNAGYDTTQRTSMAFDPNGKLWISWYDSTATDLMVAYSDVGGSILMAPPQRLTLGGSIAESHADMTTTSDTANRDDADCIGGGTWNNGEIFVGEHGRSLTIPDGSSTAQCTEIIFTIDLSNAVVGETYRFMIATNDGLRIDRGLWRGPVSVTSGAYPTLTVGDVSFRTAKDNSARFANCNDTAWGCMAVETTNDVGQYSSMAFDSKGNPWITYYDVTNTGLRVAQYVGTGGTGCASVMWTCTALDTTNTVGQYSSIGFDPSGNAWVSFYDGAANLNLRVAKYVGSGGTGCASAAWTCTAVITSNDVGKYSSLGFDSYGNPWVAYVNATSSDLAVAKYVGANGTGCASAAWTCSTIDSTRAIEDGVSLAFDRNGDPWIAYEYGTGGADLYVARYVGSGGSGCDSNQWTCTAVETTNTVGSHTSIAFDTSGAAWVSYVYGTGSDVKVAKYVGSGGTGCATATWNCTSVDTAATVEEFYTSIAVDSAGNPWVSYYDGSATDNLKVARYLGGATTGTGCAVTTWHCYTVDATNDVGQYSSIAFDHNGVPWVSYYDNTANNNLRVAKMNQSLNPLSSSVSNPFVARNSKGADSRYKSTLGRVSSSTSDGVCSGNADYMGTCALFQNSGDYDQVSAQINESPNFTFAMRYDVNTELPTAQWIGYSSLAPNTAGTTADIYLQAYRFGSTNAWETLSSDTTSASCTSNCSLSGVPSGTDTEYFYTDSDGKYWVYFRVYQESSASSAITFKTDQFQAPQNVLTTRLGTYFIDGIRRPLNRR